LRAPSEPRRSPREFARQAFPANLEGVAGVVSFVAAHATQGLVTAEKTARLELAVEEWATNVCRHAYRSAGGSLTVVLRRDGEALLVELSDEGTPFDPTAAAERDVSLPLTERSPGGLGLLLMRRMVDELRYRREGHRNVVTFAVRS
jgi:serine/threonine-protein kinase RsbW